MIADRMISVGTLAAGMAHGINNPLATITANLDLVLEEVRSISGGSPSGRLKDLEEMAVEARTASDRIRKIVRGLMTFSRTDEKRPPAIVDIKQVLELSIGMAFNEIRQSAHLVRDYGDAPLVFVDEARLAQVFINLLVNAAQAIGDGEADSNEIRITTSTDETGRAVVEVHLRDPLVS
jgi:signal transduction histidine kinase